MIYLSIILFITLLGAVGTFLFHNSVRAVNPILASAILTLIVSVICHFLDQKDYHIIKEIPYIFIGGTFIGMSTRKKAKGLFNILLASMFFSVLYLKSSQFFQGYGGALGVSACISVLIVITSSKLFVRSKHIIRKRKRIKQPIKQQKTNI